VPEEAGHALVTITMVRRDDTFVDGSADNLGLVIIRPSTTTAVIADNP
jgi:hypothetical protein